MWPNNLEYASVSIKSIYESLCILFSDVNALVIQNWKQYSGKIIQSNFKMKEKIKIFEYIFLQALIADYGQT